MTKKKASGDTTYFYGPDPNRLKQMQDVYPARKPSHFDPIEALRYE